MKKTFFLMALFVGMASAIFAAGTPAGEGPSKSKETKQAPKTTEGLCLAIFELECAVVFNFMDCGVMECITDWGWEQKMKSYDTKYCHPIQLATPANFAAFQ